MSERMDPTAINHTSDEPSALETRIDLHKKPELIPQLQAKLAVYERRNQSINYLAPEQRGPGYYREIFKKLVLGLVLELSRDEARDFDANPIILPEIALKLIEKGFDVSRSVTVPFVYDEQAGGYYPDVSDLKDEITIVDQEFIEAYVIIRSYVTGNKWNVYGGRGLAFVDEAEEPDVIS